MGVNVFEAAPGATGLAALEARLRQDLAWLDLPARSWVPEREVDGRPLLPVVIIGGGQAGLALGATLKHLGVTARILDRSPAGYEGVWATSARMETLRSPKWLAGPALGLPALTFRAWYEAQFGLAAWDALDKIPRLAWMDYLRWYRRVLDIPVENGHAVTAIRPRADRCVELDVRSADGDTTVLARHLVLATGFDGLGGPYRPAIARRLPADRWIHSSDDYDYDRLKGLRVAVIGGGSAAMDSAATALEAGAGAVELLVRRATLPRINKSKGAGVAGHMHGFMDLPDAWKWKIRHYINVQQGPPPHGSTLRVSRHPNARFWFDAGVQAAAMDGDRVALTTPRGVFRVDFVVFATGLAIDLAQRPEFAAFAPHVRRWSDAYQPPAGAEDDDLAAAPYVGPLFEFQEKVPGSCPGLDRIYCLNNAALASQGGVSGDIPGISLKSQRLGQGIVRRLYGEDVDWHYGNIEAYAEPELFGDEWTPATGSAADHEGRS